MIIRIPIAYPTFHFADLDRDLGALLRSALACLASLSRSRSGENLGP